MTLRQSSAVVLTDTVSNKTGATTLSHREYFHNPSIKIHKILWHAAVLHPDCSHRKIFFQISKVQRRHLAKTRLRVGRAHQKHELLRLVVKIYTRNIRPPCISMIVFLL